jgi:hypothetical protein
VPRCALPKAQQAQQAPCCPWAPRPLISLRSAALSPFLSACFYKLAAMRTAALLVLLLALGATVRGQGMARFNNKDIENVLMQFIQDLGSSLDVGQAGNKRRLLTVGVSGGGGAGLPGGASGACLGGHAALQHHPEHLPFRLSVCRTSRAGWRASTAATGSSTCLMRGHRAPSPGTASASLVSWQGATPPLALARRVAASSLLLGQPRWHHLCWPQLPRSPCHAAPASGRPPRLPRGHYPLPTSPYSLHPLPLLVLMVLQSN